MLKNVIFLFIMLLFGVTNAQNTTYTVENGDLLILMEPVSNNYKYIDFPRKNIIIKRGAIPNFNNLKGLKLKVIDITYSKSKNQIVTLQRMDGKPFFRFFNTVEANINKALENNELQVVSK